MARIVSIIEARMGSSRLPGKVLKEIAGVPALERLIARLRATRSLDEVVVATSKSETDDSLKEWCDDFGVRCFRGSEEDVLQRVVDTAEFAKADIIVEITGDCPLTDPDIIDLGVETFASHQVDVVTNCGDRLTWPMGQYVQVFRHEALRQVAETIGDPDVREHVSLYFYEHPERYRIHQILAPRCWREPSWRWQLDYPEDLLFQEAVFSRLDKQGTSLFGISEIFDLLRKEPALVDINIHCEEKAVRL